MRTPSAKTKPAPLDRVITETLKLWRKYHLTYDQTRYVAKEVRRTLAIARPPTRQRVIARLSRTDEERLIAQAYRMPGVRGLLIKTLFQTGARVSEFVQVQVSDVYFDEQMLLITHAKAVSNAMFRSSRHSRTNSRRICGIARQGRCLPPSATPPIPRAVSNNSCRKRRRWRASPSASIRTCCATPWRQCCSNRGCP
jgi:integrase